MLDEECIVPKATDMTYAQKLMDQHQGKHPNFEKPKPPKGKQADAHYAIRHYAGTVSHTHYKCKTPRRIVNIRSKTRLQQVL